MQKLARGKKLVSVFIICTIIVSSCIISSSAANPTITMSDTKSDNKVVISVYFNNAGCLAVGEIDILFDANIFTFDTATLTGTDDEDYLRNLYYTSNKRNSYTLNNYGVDVTEAGKADVGLFFLDVLTNSGQYSQKINLFNVVLNVKSGMEPKVRGSVISISSSVGFDYGSGVNYQRITAEHELTSSYVSEIKNAPTYASLTDNLSGNDVVVYLYLKDALEMYSCNLNIAYDSNVFTCKSMSYYGTSAENYINTLVTNRILMYSPNISAAGNAKLGLSFLDCLTEDSGYGSSFNVAKLVFEVKSGKEMKVENSLITVTGNVKGYLGEATINKNYNIISSFFDGYPMGDVDDDYVVSSADARLVLRYSVGLEALGEAQLIYANMDYDESISSADARLILRTSVGLEASSKHDFQKNGNYYKCTDCSKQFHFHKYAHHNCYSSQKCFCGAENGVLAGHKFDLKNLKCSSCNVELAALGEKAYTAVKAINQIKTDRKNAYDAYNKKDYSKFMLSGYSVASNYAVVGNALEKNKDFENVYNDFADGARVLRDVTIKVHNSSTGVLDTSPNSVELMKKALDEVEKYEKEAVKSLLAMVEPYEDLLNGIEGLDSLIKLF